MGGGGYTIRLLPHVNGSVGNNYGMESGLVGKCSVSGLGMVRVGYAISNRAASVHSEPSDSRSTRGRDEFGFIDWVDCLSRFFSWGRYFATTGNV